MLLGIALILCGYGPIFYLNTDRNLGKNGPFLPKKFEILLQVAKRIEEKKLGSGSS
jgi:hypothetical protein